MKALRFHGARDIRYESMDDPVLHDDRDVLVKVTGCAICGSDLHIYHGEGFSEDLGFCVGHEAVGEVVEIGRGVRRLKSGDKVMISAAVGCGACASCLRGDVVRCETGSGACYGLSSRLQGSQAEAVRVPAGDFNAAIIPDGVSEDQALLLTDGMATAWYGVTNADIRPGGSAAVVGLGPIGLMAVEQILVKGAARVFAIDPVPERRAIAEELGALALHPDEAVETIRELTRGRMVDSIVEAVGHDRTIDLALRLAARRGTVSVIGVNQDRRFDFPMARAFAMGLTFRIGTCSVQETWPELIPLLQAGRLKPERMISHRLPLSAGAEAYAMFDGRKDGALKMVLTP
ncbi:MAG: alcohol dehydrogenase [Caulobacteraceae bacterium]|nr:alcohol dehydrogenase family protein [Caulobacter sp.]RYF94873.1 MAG: alcohol dehydrogenase [Caulobacteraceae bacterium]